MTSVPPPALPESLRRIQFRLWQISMSALTVGLTGYLYFLHPAAGITAAFLAKHILVAILQCGLDKE